MSALFVENKLFEKQNYSVTPLAKGEYENCNFNLCDFSNSDLKGINFTQCTFSNCNFSLANVTKTSFRDAVFKDCKLLGIHFHNCNEFLFSVSFENCILNLSSFYKLKLKKTRFFNCSLHEVDFSESDLSNALLGNCDLSRAIFNKTILEKADLSTAYNYSIYPEINKIKKAKFSLRGLPGLLEKYDIIIED